MDETNFPRSAAKVRGKLSHYAHCMRHLSFPCAEFAVHCLYGYVKTTRSKVRLRTLRDGLRVNAAYMLSVSNMEEAAVTQQTTKNPIHRLTSRANREHSLPLILQFDSGREGRSLITNSNMREMHKLTTHENFMCRFLTTRVIRLRILLRGKEQDRPLSSQLWLPTCPSCMRISR
jgi:hypothetical protein